MTIKTLPLILLLLAATAAAQDIKTTYDRFKDETAVFTPYRTVAGRRDGFGYVRVQGIFRHKGTAVTENVPVFALWFSRAGAHWQFLRNNHLILLIDGESVNLGDGRHDGKVNSSRYAPTVEESVGYKLERPVLEKIAKARKVEMQLGEFEGEMDEKTIAAFQELLKAATP